MSALPTNNGIMLRQHYNRADNAVVECSVLHQSSRRYMF